MSAMRWDDVSDLFDPDTMGALPDGWVDRTTVADWQALFDLVRTGPWPWRCLDDRTEIELPAAAELPLRPDDAATVVLHVEMAPDAWVVFWFLGPGRIDFDLELRFLQGQERLDRFCELLRSLSHALGKSVWLGPEGASGDPVLGFDVTADRMVRLAARAS
ncbi:hypothetical protein [Cellulomonas dongxiuzhuiae]|uniref:hypothetical protein n=1 Tax=Cellulomonas dongxiuzhuiae TaxID=2819979 RepID=UPI001AAEA9C3|nr:hypothetical protein [Cellulomonas dongxiuzhuiae]MBO3089570.1 hypothetical protein [Cellulomonas dongxiuzhuiae]